MADCGAWVTVFPCPLTQSACLRSPQPRLRNSSPRRTLVPRLFWGTYVKRTFISAAAILAFTAAGHADELSDIQAQAKQLRDQNATMTKRLADLEKRQKALETQKPVLINPVDAMAADLPYKAAVKARPPENDDICIKGICVYGNFDMGVTYIQHSAAVRRLDCRSAGCAGFEERRPGFLFRSRRQPVEHLVHRLARQAGDRR